MACSVSCYRVAPGLANSENVFSRAHHVAREAATAIAKVKAKLAGRRRDEVQCSGCRVQHHGSNGFLPRQIPAPPGAPSALLITTIMQPCDSRRSSPLPSPPHTRPAAIGGSRRVTVRSELLCPLMPCRSSFCVLAQLCRICPSADHCASSSSEAVCVIAYFWVRLSIREIAKLVARHIAQRRLRLRPKLPHGNLPEIQWPEEDCDFSLTATCMSREWAGLSPVQGIGGRVPWSRKLRGIAGWERGDSADSTDPRFAHYPRKIGQNKRRERRVRVLGCLCTVCRGC